MSNATHASHESDTHTHAGAEGGGATGAGTRRHGDAGRMIRSLTAFPGYGPSAEDRGDPDAPAPAAPAAPAAKEMNARVVARETVKEGVRLMISIGANHGVRVGMPGYLTDGRGKHGDDIAIDETLGLVSFATVERGHHDTILKTMQVVLNPGAKP